MPTSNRPRRKAKQRRARETVDVVLDAAARVLAERGHASATTNRIAQTAGVSVGTVYEYFANKEAVFEALITRELGRLVDAIASQPLSPEAPIDVKLGALVRGAMAAMRHGPSFYRSLEQVPNAVFRNRLVEARATVVGFVRDLLVEHRDELRVRDSDLAAFVVVSAVEGVGANASEDVFDERLATEVTDLVRAYLAGTG
jgi:AcrR family transcriptional regulator